MRRHRLRLVGSHYASAKGTSLTSNKQRSQNLEKLAFAAKNAKTYCLAAGKCQKYCQEQTCGNSPTEVSERLTDGDSNLSGYLTPGSTYRVSETVASRLEAAVRDLLIRQHRESAMYRRWGHHQQHIMNSFKIPTDTSPVVWVNAHIGTPGFLIVTPVIFTWLREWEIGRKRR